MTFKVVRATRTTIREGRHLCFASSQTLGELDVNPGQPLELVNEAGAPLRLWVEDDATVAQGAIAIDEVALQVLRVSFDDRVPVRRLRGTHS
jgi:hypothetical protein